MGKLEKRMDIREKMMLPLLSNLYSNVNKISVDASRPSSYPDTIY